MKNPKVSVIIPTYNCAKYLPEAIESVLAQSFRNFEIIVVDDASTDNSQSILDSYRNHPQIKILTNSKNQGVSRSRNLGISKATGEYIAFLDSDDFWQKDKLAEQVAVHEKEGINFSCTGIFWKKEGSKVLGKIIPSSMRISKSDLLKQNLIALSSVMLKKEILPQPAFESRGNEDYALWLQLLEKIPYCRVLQAPLTTYRIRKASRSSKKLRSAQSNWRIYRQVAHLSRTRAFYYLIQFTVRSAFKYLRLRIFNHQFILNS